MKNLIALLIIVLSLKCFGQSPVKHLVLTKPGTRDIIVLDETRYVLLKTSNTILLSNFIDSRLIDLQRLGSSNGIEIVSDSTILYRGKLINISTIKYIRCPDKTAYNMASFSRCTGVMSIIVSGFLFIRNLQFNPGSSSIITNDVHPAAAPLLGGGLALAGASEILRRAVMAKKKTNNGSYKLLIK